VRDIIQVTTVTGTRCFLSDSLVLHSVHSSFTSIIVIGMNSICI